MIEVPREKLENIIKECWKYASPYTGEYWEGKADLANELLGNPEIDWDKHPRSLENMIKTQGLNFKMPELVDIKHLPLQSSNRRTNE